MVNGAHMSTLGEQSLLHSWREEVLTLIARLMSLLLIPVLVPTMLIALRMGTYGWLLFNVIAFGMLLVVAFVPRLGFVLRTGLLLGTIYLGAIGTLLLDGLMRTGQFSVLGVVWCSNP